MVQLYIASFTSMGLHLGRQRSGAAHVIINGYVYPLALFLKEIL